MHLTSNTTAYPIPIYQHAHYREIEGWTYNLVKCVCADGNTSLLLFPRPIVSPELGISLYNDIAMTTYGRSWITLFVGWYFSHKLPRSNQDPDHNRRRYLSVVLQLREKTYIV
jgi:hypothetical protein